MLLFADIYNETGKRISEEIKVNLLGGANPPESKRSGCESYGECAML